MIGLDYENERYVRAYVRDTEEYLLLPWQAQGLYWAIRRKADRAGLLAARNGVDSIALLIRWPREVVAEFLPDLVARGFVTEDLRGYLLPEFLASEEARQSNAQRSRESRAKRSEVAAVYGSDPRVEHAEDRDEQPDPRVANDAPRAATATPAPVLETKRAELQRSVTAAAQNVTGSTLLPVPSVPTVESARSNRYEQAKRVFAFMEAERKAVDPRARATAQIHCEDLITKLLGMGHTEDDLLHVVRVYAWEARQRPDDPLRWFQAATIWQPDNVERAKSRRLPAPRRAGDAEPDGYRYAGEKR
jgi:hypothetical protein